MALQGSMGSSPSAEPWVTTGCVGETPAARASSGYTMVRVPLPSAPPMTTLRMPGSSSPPA
eukprot:7547651-Alexandrium_andersonii.AAC.1